MHLKNNLYKSWIEISKSALLYDLHTFQRMVGKKIKVAAVVKANAYGHGLKEVVAILRDEVKIFAVDSLDEALVVRKIDKKAKVIILGYLVSANIKTVIECGFSFVVYRLDILKQIVSLGFLKKALVHIKIETGLNRQGIDGKDLLKVLDYIRKHKDKIFFEGVYTHFANVEDTLDSSYAQKQLKKFDEALKIVELKGFNPSLVHTAASAATLLLERSRFSMVRVGIGLYGLWPSRETKIAVLSKRMKVSLKPVLSWKSIIAQVKNVAKGESVGYGRAWFSRRKSKIAVIPIGYSDGFDRKLSNVGRVIIRESFAPIIGRVAMNMIMVDVTDIKRVRAGDIVVIIGRTEGNLAITPDEIAEKIGTINYEVVSRINPLLPRIVI